MNFRLIDDGDYEMRFVSPQFTDCDWPIRFFIRLEYMEEHLSERELKEFGGKYACSIVAVAPKAINLENRNAAIQSGCGDKWVNEQGGWDNMDELTQCDILLSYGTYATLWQSAGNNKWGLIRQAKAEAKSLPMFIGFKLDRQQNAIGNSGWDFLQGNIGFGQSMKTVVENATNAN